jgi:transcriptional regulator with XRE-family HTH domain
MNITSTVGKRIRNRRVELGYSVDELAKKLGKNRATVYRYESDEIENLPLSVIGPLAAALETTPGYLMGWEEKEQPTTVDGNELNEIMHISKELTPDNRAKLIELSRLYLDAQRKNSENQ